MKTDNELIAEFMGIERHPKEKNLFWIPENESWNNWEHLKHLNYHRSWDWLMPVVQKIETIYSKAFPPGEEFIRRILAHEEPIEEQYVDVLSLPMSTPINEVYKAVVEFIKWYNANK